MCALVTALSTLAFQPAVRVPVHAPAVAVASVPVCMTEQNQLSRRAFVASAAALPAFLAQGAFAEQTLDTRNVPRVERGRDYWATGVKKAIGASDWATLGKAIEKKGSIDRIFGPMQLWASSFSGKSISEKTIAMNAAVDELRDAVKFLDIAVQGTEKSGGFLGFGGSKKIEEGKRQQLAAAAYQKGVSAINKFIEIGNDGMGLQVSLVGPSFAVRCTHAHTSHCPAPRQFAVIDTID